MHSPATDHSNYTGLVHIESKKMDVKMDIENKAVLTPQKLKEKKCSSSKIVKINTALSNATT
jgi:hypothetical protein